MTAPPLKGKVLKILNNYAVVLNVGSENGATKGMKFIIYEEGEMIRDPETNADIEKLEIVKAFVEITSVQQKICIAESYETIKKIIRPFEYMLTPYYEREEEVTEKKPLADIGTVAVPFAVKVGDLARSIK